MPSLPTRYAVPYRSSYVEETNFIGDVTVARTVDLASDFGYLMRLPASIQNYLVEEAPIDFSTFDVYQTYLQRGATETLKLMRESAVEQLNEDTRQQRIEARRRGLQPTEWPMATLWNTRPIRRLQRKAGLPQSGARP